MNAPSHIGIQNHGAGDDVYFRNIRIKQLPKQTTAPVTTAKNSPAEPDGRVARACAREAHSDRGRDRCGR
ncbi:MAG TPA: hypothetical protein VFX61_14590 [Micromonosporaceae bacterium]|nr:hypothetical protein [Micromonosporaceae bacterium]